MAATLSIRDYLDHFFFNRDKELTHHGRGRLDSCNGQQPSTPPACYNGDMRLGSPTKSNNNLAQLQNHGLMLAHVHEYSKGGEESLIYSKRIEGNKSADVYGIFVQEMIGTRSLKGMILFGDLCYMDWVIQLAGPIIHRNKGFMKLRQNIWYLAMKSKMQSVVDLGSENRLRTWFRSPYLIND